jgi:hypothetical protein
LSLRPISKLYDKTSQERVKGDNRIIRFEVVYKRKPLKRMGIQNLQDIVNTNKVNRLINLYIKDFDSITYIDFKEALRINEEKAISSSIKNFLMSYTNPRMWRRLNSLDANEKRRIKRRLIKLLKTYPELTSRKALFRKELELEIKRCYEFDFSK